MSCGLLAVCRAVPIPAPDVADNRRMRYEMSILTCFRIDEAGAHRNNDKSRNVQPSVLHSSTAAASWPSYGATYC